MAIIEDKELKKLNIEKHNLYRKNASKKEIDSISEKIKTLINKYIFVNSINRRVKKMEEEQILETPKEENKTESKPKKRKVFGMNTFVKKALLTGEIKNKEQLLEQLKKWMPEKIEKEIKTSIYRVLRDVKNKKGFWANYTWNEETFLVTKNN